VLHRRPELNGPATADAIPSAWPRSEARDLLEAMSGGEPLVEQFTLEQARTEREVVVRGRRAGILSLDRVRVVAGGVAFGLLHVVELEFDAASTPSADDAEHLVRALERIDGLRADPMTKIQHALALIGRS
jgi:inorganic triphosphatase YgiF